MAETVRLYNIAPGDQASLECGCVVRRGCNLSLNDQVPVISVTRGAQCDSEHIQLHKNTRVRPEAFADAMERIE
jgi:hypothetical protein